LAIKNIKIYGLKTNKKASSFNSYLPVPNI